MDWITDELAIGNYREGRDRALLADAGIRSVVCLIPSELDADDLGLEAHEVVPLIDGLGNESEIFRQAVDSVIDFAESAPKLMVHCHAGRSRSVIVVAGYLMRTRGWPSGKALEFVLERRDGAVTAGLEWLLR